MLLKALFWDSFYFGDNVVALKGMILDIFQVWEAVVLL